MHQSVNLKQTCTSGFGGSLISEAFKENVTLPSLWNITDNVRCSLILANGEMPTRTGDHLWKIAAGNSSHKEKAKN